MPRINVERLRITERKIKRNIQRQKKIGEDEYRRMKNFEHEEMVKEEDLVNLIEV